MGVVPDYVRQAVLKGYAYVLMPVLFLGVICFFAASLLYWRRGLSNISYIIALCSWILIAARVSLLVLIAATSFPGLSPSYLWPAQLLLVTGAFFSCVACFQLSGCIPVPRPKSLSDQTRV